MQIKTHYFQNHITRVETNWSLQNLEATENFEEQFLTSGMYGFKTMIIRS
jgi:hypothetical protein